MAKMKTEFVLEVANEESIDPSISRIWIIGSAPNSKPYVSISTDSTRLHFIQDKDLERFAVNILKSLKSKRLKP